MNPGIQTTGTASANSLFISYGHNDMQPVNWIERLKLYLAPLRRNESVEIWDDSRIQAGAEWRKEIREAVERATCAILLIGPAFMASEFIERHELSTLLLTHNTRGCRIYPLVVGYCSYRVSALEKFQAFNDPDKPLEALSTAEQNRILNHVCLTVDADLRRGQPSFRPAAQVRTDTQQAMIDIARHLEVTWTAFVAQCRRRDQLVGLINDRLKIRQSLEYENFFFRYFGQLNHDEKFLFEQIRAMTEGPLYKGNQEILSIIEQNPEVLNQVSAMKELRQHLVFWLNKYERIFLKKPEMCLLYAGVEDGVPFPKGIDGQIAKWLKNFSGKR